MIQLNVLDTFNAIVVDKSELTQTPDLSLVKIGVVTNFKISSSIKTLLEGKFKPLPINTLFSREERLHSDPFQLITKQILHYFEVYGLNQPGLFELEVNEGVVIKPTFVKGITHAELVEKINSLMYANAPIKDVAAIVAIIKGYNIPYDFARIVNNELRVQIYDPKKHIFTNGDDAVRYLVYKATNESLVIKNKKVIEAIKIADIDSDFFIKNDVVLSEVFNRFKPLILAAKKKNVSNNAFSQLSSKFSGINKINTAINKIARMSKSNHKPVHEGFNKRFLALALDAIKNGTFDKFSPNVSKLSVRDKFKILNLIEYKSKGLTVDSFVIRNGTVHIEQDRKVLNKFDLDFVRDLLVKSLSEDYADLKSKKIVIDEKVDYGLPISRKQTLGNLPYGSTIEIDGTISSGVYWENAWGANDLDLSTVDLHGNRVGWGGYAGYGKGDIIFSGDVTSAYNGAMEFMTSNDSTYGLFVNIFSGNNNSEFELVVGTTSDKKWIETVVVREKSKLLGRGSVIGFVEGNKYRVFQAKLNDRIANFNEGSPVINRALAPVWTVKKLFDAIGVVYDTVAKNDVEYDFNLEYSNFSIDKLEDLLYK